MLTGAWLQEAPVPPQSWSSGTERTVCKGLFPEWADCVGPPLLFHFGGFWWFSFQMQPQRQAECVVVFVFLFRNPWNRSDNEIFYHSMYFNWSLTSLDIYLIKLKFFAVSITPKAVLWRWTPPTHFSSPFLFGDALYPAFILRGRNFLSLKWRSGPWGDFNTERLQLRQ